MAGKKKFTDYTLDPRNANQGTERGEAQLEDSLRLCGAGRSVVADRNGTILAGNKTLVKASELGLKIREIDTDGTELVVVRRTDLDLNGDDRARLLAFADNRVSQTSLFFDNTIVLDAAKSLDLTPFWSDKELDVMAGNHAGDAADAVGMGTDKDGAQPADTVERLKFGKYAVPLSAGELEMLTTRIENYIQENGTTYGFAASLCS